MLQSTFCHIPGVGQGTERRFWEAGILSWDLVTRTADHPGLRRSAARVAAHIERSRERFAEGDVLFFQRELPSREHWRLLPHFRPTTAYVDIETTGLSPGRDIITTIALYDGREIRHYVYGRNLDDFPAAIQRYTMLVTYNGKCFDVPFMERFFGIRLPHAHVDLRYVLSSLGYRGGLKGCERELGLGRGELEGIDGFFAVLLWRDYVKNANAAALETLLAYNIQDVVNLEMLMVLAYNQKLAGTPFQDRYALSLPALPALPFVADTATVERIKREGFGGYG